MRDLRASGLLILVKVVVVATFAVALYTFGTFAQSTSRAVNGSLANDRGVELYGLIDSFLADPDGFERFRASEEDLTTLIRFLDGLESSARVDLLAAFDQPLVVRDFGAGKDFDANAGTDIPERGAYTDEHGVTVRDVQSMQMNREAFEFARLRVASGSIPTWATIDYRSGVLPVVLGASYEGVFALGDELDAHLYGAEQRLRVVGFLETGSALFYRGQLNHFLDETIVVPYPSDLGALLRDDQYLAGIVAFAMLNSDLAAPADATFDEVVNELGAIASTSGFTSYSLQGVATYLVQLRLVRQIVVENFALLSGVMLMIGLATVVLCWRINLAVCSRRDAWVAVRRAVGHDDRAIIRAVASGWFLEYAVIIATYALWCAWLPNHHAYPFLGILALLALWFSVDGVARRRLLLSNTGAQGVSCWRN